MPDAQHALDAQQLLTQAGRLRAIARSLAGEGAAEDLVQDTWVAALEAEVRGSARDAEGWRAWLGAVTRNLARRRALREGRRPAVEERAARPEAQGGVADLAERMEQQRRLADALLALEEPYRSALALRYLDGLDHAAIAERQGVTNANARRRVSRGLAMLRARMGVEEPASRGKPFAGLFAWTGLFRRGESAGASGIGAPLGAGGALVGAKSVLGAAAVVAGVAVVVTIAVREPVEPPLQELEVAAAEEVPASNTPEVGGAALERELGLEPGSYTAYGGRARESLAAAEGGVRGVVTSTAGQPLADVDVHWCFANGEAVDFAPAFETDDAGRYQSPRPAGGAQLAFELAGYLPQVLDASTDGELEVVLRACPRLVGQLRGESGAPTRPPGRVRAWVLPEGAEEPVESVASLEEDGSYQLGDLPVGRLVRVWARAKGFEAIEEPRDLQLEPETTQRLDLELPSGLVVVGVVLDELSREPVPFAEIWSEGWDYDPDSDEPTTVADAEGRFRIEGITRDKNEVDGWEYYTVRLSARGPEHASSPLKAFGLQPDDEGVCELELLLVRRSCSLRAVLYEPGREKPAQGVFVWSIDAENNLDYQRSNRHGEIEFDGLPAGPFALEAYRLERGESGHYESLLLELELEPGSHDVVELELRSEPETAIEGRLTGADGAARAGVDVVAHHTFRFGGVAVSLDSEQRTTDAEGRYRFEGLRVGRYRVVPGGCAEPGSESFALAWGERRRGVDFLVGGCMGIEGRVEHGGLAVEDLRVELHRAGTLLAPDSERKPIQSVSPEPDGTFRLEEVLEGDFFLVLVRDKEVLDRAPVGPGSSSGVLLRAR